MKGKGTRMKMVKQVLLLLILFANGCSPAQHSASIYDEQADAHHDVAVAISTAGQSERNIVLIFGANWCEDCHALHDQMQKPELAAIIAKNFVVVEIDLGSYDKNLDLAERYHVPIKRGIPAVAVLDPRGNILYAMKEGQFADARSMSYESIKEFFVKWKPS